MLADPLLDSLRSSILAARKKSKLYPIHLRSSVLAWIRLPAQACLSTSALAKLLGLPTDTLRYWLAHPSPTSTFLPVVVRPSAPPPAALSLLLPGGARVDGLSLDDLAFLCRRMAS